MKALNLLVLVVGILTFISGLVGFPSAASETSYMVAGAILITGAAIGMSVASISQPNHKDEDTKRNG